MTTYSPGDTVTFTAGPLGTLEHEDDYRFAGEVVLAGDTGLYVGPHFNPELARQDWSVVRVELRDVEDTADVVRFVPVHSSQIERAR